jgi:hypothetical protein
MRANMEKYKYIPETIFRIYAGILKYKYRVVQRKSLLSEGSYIIDLYQDYTGVYASNNSRKVIRMNNRHSATLHPIIYGLVRF